MDWENSRREFLKTGFITGTVGFTGTSKANQGGQATTFSGTFTDPDGNPLPNADIIIYDAESDPDQPAAQTTTDTNGEFTTGQFNPPENPFLVVKHSDTGFFRSVPNVTPETFTNQPEIIPDSQLLYGPTLANQNTSTARGIITVWREFRAENQLLNIEITSPPGDGSPTDSLRENALTGASFSFTAPETVYIDYENTTIIYTPLEIEQYTERPNYILNWYPSKVGLPLRHSTANFGNLFEELTQQRIRQEEDQGQFGQMLVNTLLGEIPGYSTITGLGEVLAVATGQDHETSTVQVAGTNVESPDRNEFDTASGVQPLHSYSTIYQVPIRFTEDSGEERRLVAEANWSTNDSADREVADRFRFQENISVSSLESETENDSENTSANNDAWPRREYDSAGSRHNPAASGPSPPIEIKWKYEGAKELPVVTNGKVYSKIGSHRGSEGIVGIDAKTGEEQWSFSKEEWFSPEPFYGLSLLTADSDTLYAGTEEGNMLAVDTNNGDEKWMFESDESENMMRVSVGPNGTVYGYIDGKMHAIDPDSREEKWSSRYFTGSDAVFATSEDMVYYKSMDYDSDKNDLIAIDANNGEELWRYTDPSYGTLIQDTLFIGKDNRVSALNAASGEEGWGFEIEDISQTPSVVAGNSNTIYATGRNTVFSINTEERTERWRKEVPNASFLTVGADTIYIGDSGSSGGDITALNPETGEIRWQKEGVSPNGIVPVVGDTLYGANSAELFALE